VFGQFLDVFVIIMTEKCTKTNIFVPSLVKNQGGPPTLSPKIQGGPPTLSPARLAKVAVLPCLPPKSTYGSCGSKKYFGNDFGDSVVRKG
jgi:hypothetical protein